VNTSEQRERWWIVIVILSVPERNKMFATYSINNMKYEYPNYTRILEYLRTQKQEATIFI